MRPFVVTYLEMHSSLEVCPKRSSDPRFWIGEATVPQWSFNRYLYQTVGAAWDWRDKLVWSDQEWQDYVETDRLRTFVGYVDGAPAGYYELLRDPVGGIQIAYFGLMPAFIGLGYGGALLTDALERAWRMGPNRVWVHTCNHDHPSALPNYQARGFQIYKVESLTS
jgi:GNAT superfamily N-acetyltransferase